MDCSLSGSSVCGLFQARILEWIATPSSKGSSQPRIKPYPLLSPALADGFFSTSTTWEARVINVNSLKYTRIWGPFFHIVRCPRQHIKRQRHYFANKCLSSQGYGFSSSHVWMWELDYKESWVLKNWCFCTVVLEKTLESPLDCKEIQPVHPKGDQSWVFIGRTDAEAETPILWPLDAKSWLIWKDPDAGKDWGQEEKGMTEDKMVGWHHQLSGHGFG